MATMTAAEMSAMVLEHLGVKAAGQSATGADTVATLTAIGAVHAMHGRDGIAPYDVGAIPEWAQLPFRDCVALEMAGHFGIAGERLSMLIGAYQKAVATLHRQTSGRHDPRLRVKATYY